MAVTQEAIYQSTGTTFITRTLSPGLSSSLSFTPSNETPLVHFIVWLYNILHETLSWRERRCSPHAGDGKYQWKSSPLIWAYFKCWGIKGVDWNGARSEDLKRKGYTTSWKRMHERTGYWTGERENETLRPVKTRTETLRINLAKRLNINRTKYENHAQSAHIRTLQISEWQVDKSTTKQSDNWRTTQAQEI